MPRHLLLLLPCGAAFQLLACGAPVMAVAPDPAELRREPASALEDRGDLAGALAYFDRLCAEAERDERSCFEAARLAFGVDAPGPARARALELLAALPEHSSAEKLLRSLARSFLDTGEPATGASTLERLAGELASRRLAFAARFEAARLAREAGDSDGEQRCLEELARTTTRESSVYWDDAVFRLSELARAQAGPQGERRWLEKLVESDESSWLLGSYRSRFHDRALLRLAELDVEAGRYERAVAGLTALADDETSRLADDALLAKARIERQQGRVSSACLGLERLLKRFPRGNQHREAARLAQEYGCRQKGLPQ